MWLNKPFSFTFQDAFNAFDGTKVDEFFTASLIASRSAINRLTIVNNYYRSVIATL